MVEGDLVDRFLYFECPRRRVLFQRHDRGLDRRALLFHAGNFLDDDRYVFREVEVLPHPVANLLEGVRRDFDVAPEWIAVGRGIARPGGEQTLLEAFGDRVAIKRPTDEDYPVDSLLVGTPGATGPPFEIPMYALQQKLVVVALEIEDALHPKNLVAQLSNHRAKPHAHLQAIKIARLLDTDGVDVPQVVVMMVAVMMMIVLVVTVMVVVVLELDGEVDRAEVEDCCMVEFVVSRTMDA